jgi:hypothetical protein
MHASARTKSRIEEADLKERSLPAVGAPRPSIFDLFNSGSLHQVAHQQRQKASIYISRALMLFLWGATGAGFYLLRRLYSFVQNRTYDPSMKGMYMVRVLIGGISGTMIPILFYPELMAIDSTVVTVGTATIYTASGIAVASGFSAKIVYGALEAVVRGVAASFGLTKTA